MSRGKILIVDDNKSVLSALALLLQGEFSSVKTSTTPSLIPSLLSEESFDVILLDMNFTQGVNSGEEGIRWLSEIKKLSPGTEVVMFTAYGEVDIAVKALKEGAFDFITKPWENDKLIATLKSAFRLRMSNAEIAKLKKREGQLKKVICGTDSTSLVGKSPAVAQLLSTIRKVAHTDANVLITGENGTGKELIAREIHRLSERRNEIFVGVDVGALPETLFESELFGHAKGAFTDAKEERMGKFQLAENGTLFLDEIGNIPLHLQSKLLTAIQTKKITPIGSNHEIPVNIRLICATNARIDELVAKGEFREDLYFRINTIHIESPPLRNRTGDIGLLANYFLELLAKKYHKNGLTFSQGALNKIEKHAWPGNIRELQHAIERAIIMTDGKEITANDFIFKPPRKLVDDSPETLEEMEQRMINRALEKHNGNLSATAEQLGIARQTLYNKMRRYGI